MSTPTFSWSPRTEPTGSVTYRTRSAQFGDGYKQAVADGINNKVQSWPLTFTGDAAKIVSIRDFLDARDGWQSFYWTPPLGTRGLYRCSAHNLRPLGGGGYELTATFEQSFQP